MSKELTPTEEVLYKTKIDERFLGQEVYLLKEDSAVRVAKYLKALEIIKKELNLEVKEDNGLYRLITYQSDNHLLRKYQFDLLKEVLK